MNKIFTWVDSFLNTITMYRLVLYILTVSALFAFLLCSMGVFSFDFFALIQSFGIIFIVSFLSNYICAKIFNAPINPESQWISSFILFLILAPPTTPVDLWIPAFVAMVTTLSKYFFAVRKKHIFNPVAISLVILGLLGRGEAIWWVGSALMLPVVVIGGVLLLRKLRRFSLFFSFILLAVLSSLYIGVMPGQSTFEIVLQMIISGPLIFFAAVMLTEPQTTPPSRVLQIVYGVFVGVLFGLQFKFGLFGVMLYSTPQLSLVIGNIFSYIVSPKEKPFLFLKEKKKIARTTFRIIFTSKHKLQFKPGQYLEWTLPHSGADTRGSRRYFTIASSPTEETLDIGIKYNPDQASSFKRALMDLEVGNTVIASQLSGEFTLPKDKSRKLVFIAGGIGVTPFRSMIKYLLDTGEQRNVVFFYSNKVEDEIAYRDVFNQAQMKLGILVVYTLTDKEVSESWVGERGYIDAVMIQKYVPDYRERDFYISGPHAMVSTFEDTLAKMNVPSKQIKVDFFPGFV